MVEKGYPITGWFAQTNQGCRMLGKDVFIWEEVPDLKVKHVKLVECPVCNGIGAMPYPGEVGIIKSCFVCNGSGITRNGHWNKWQDWQLENIRKDFAV